VLGLDAAAPAAFLALLAPRLATGSCLVIDARRFSSWSRVAAGTAALIRLL